MGLDLVIQCENANLDWRFMTLSQNEVQEVPSRDTEAEVAATVKAITDEMLEDPRFNSEG